MAKEILSIEIDAKNAIKTMNELDDAIKEQTKSLKKAKIGSEEFTQEAAKLDKLKQAQGRVTDEVKRNEKARKDADRARQKEIATMERQKQKWQDIIKAANMEARTNDELRQKLNAMIAIREKTMIKGSQAYNKQTAEIQKLDKQLKTTDATMGRHQRNVGNYPKIAAGMVAAVGAIVMAFRTVSKVVKQSVDAFLVQDDINLKVNNTFGEYADTINRAANETQALTRIGNEQYQKLAVLASNMGVANGQVNKTVQDAIGLSELYKDAGLNQETAMKALALAQQGNYTQLQRYVPELRNANTEEEKAAILKELTAKGFAMAEKNAASYQGRLTQMKNAYGDLQEEVGGQLLGALFDPKDGNQIVDSINQIIEGLNKTKFIKTLVESWLSPFKEFGKLFKQIGELFGASADSGELLEGVLGFLMKTFEMTTVPIKILIGYISGMIDFWVKMYDIVTNIKDAKFEDIFYALVDAIYETITPLTDLLGLTDELNNLLGRANETVSEQAKLYSDLMTGTVDLKAETQKYIDTQKELEEQSKAATEELEAQNEAADEAKKAYEALTTAIFNANQQYSFSTYFAKDRNEQWDAEKKRIEDLITAYKNYLAQGGWTQAELEKFAEYKNKLDVELDEVKQRLFDFNTEVNEMLLLNPMQILPSKEELEKQLAETEKTINDMMNKRVVANNQEDKARQDQIKKDEDAWNQRRDIAASTAAALGDIVASSIDETGFNLEKFGKMYTQFILDQLQKVVLASVAEITAKQFASKGLAGAVTAGVISGSVMAAFGVAKAAIANLYTGGEVGGYTGDGGKYQPAGAPQLVQKHKGEVVFSQADVAALGGATAVDKMRPTSRQNLYTGGIVGLGSVQQPNANQQIIEALSNLRPVVTVEDINAVARAESNRNQISVI